MQEGSCRRGIGRGGGQEGSCRRGIGRGGGQGEGAAGRVCGGGKGADVVLRFVYLFQVVGRMFRVEPDKEL
eukprot:366230-Chlamydomonas_euryale.AAC.31